MKLTKISLLLACSIVRIYAMPPVASMVATDDDDDNNNNNNNNGSIENSLTRSLLRRPTTATATDEDKISNGMRPLQEQVLKVVPIDGARKSKVEKEKDSAKNSRTNLIGNTPNSNNNNDNDIDNYYDNNVPDVTKKGGSRNSAQYFEEEDQQMEYVIISCPMNMSMEQCKEYIETTVTQQAVTKSMNSSQKSVTTKHVLSSTHAIAIEIPKQQLGGLQVEYELDPIRELLHLPDSYEEFKSRRLSQEIPDGVLQISAPDVWSQYQTTGENVTVCVVDTGLLRGHEDFEGANLSGSDNWEDVVTPWYEDGNGHGTHVAGTVGARNNNVGVSGVAPGVDLFIVRVFDNRGSFRASDIQAAAEECRIGGADIINMSLGGSHYSTKEEAALSRLYYEYGIITVAAAGNSGNQGNAASYPAAHPVVVSVGAVNFQGEYANFSTRNNNVDISAPGVRVLSTSKNGKYSYLSGTSMACPHVAAVLALLKSFRPYASSQDLISAIMTTAIDKGVEGKDIYYGNGVVNSLKAIELLESWYPEEEEEAENIGNSHGCGDNQLSLQLTIRTDFYGDDTTWELTNTEDPNFSLTGGPYLDEQEFIVEECLDQGCYTLTVFDLYGDGLCCTYGDGFYDVTVDGTSIYRTTGEEENFSEQSHQFGACGSAKPEEPIEEEEPPCQNMDLLVITDLSADETSFRLSPYRDDLPDYGRETDTIWFAGFDTLDNWKRYELNECLNPLGCYQFDIYDRSSNGIQGWGRGIRLSFNEEVEYEGRSFGAGGFILIGQGCP